MHIKAEHLDDLLHQIFRKLLKSKSRTRSTKGAARELITTLLTINDPRARFSRTERRAVLFSCLGETLWYLSGSAQLVDKT
jgi:thymidylate synthase